MTLDNLPPELHLMLFPLLDYESLLQLGHTNKYFHSIFRREHIVAALYQAEDEIADPSSIRKERLACFRCYKLRSASFDFDRRGIQPQFTVKGEEAGRRRCLICWMPTFPREEKGSDSNGKSGKRASATAMPMSDPANKHRGFLPG